MSEQLERINGYLARIENRYNPEFDVPDGPQVTYADYKLVEVARALVSEVDKLNQKIEILTARLDRKES